MASWEPLSANGTDPLPAVTSPRIPPGGWRELGLFGWLFCKLAARVWGVPELHMFTVLAQHKRLFWSWGPFAGLLLHRGRLPLRDTEVVILRVDTCAAASTSCSSTAGSPSGAGRRWHPGKGLRLAASPRWAAAREQALLASVDELIATRAMSDAGWRLLAGYLDRRQLIEFVTLVGQYDALAMTLSTLGVPFDYPD